MKKTLIALAVATSAAVSGTAMAWEVNGTGGSVNLGGTLTPIEKTTPWEVKVGNGVSDLNSPIQRGQTNVSLQLPKDVLVLGVRSEAQFSGAAGISPQLDYADTVDTSSFQLGLADLSLPVKNDNGDVIGTLSTKIAASGQYNDLSEVTKSTIIATQAGDAFWGGIPDQNTKVMPAIELANRLDTSILEKYPNIGVQVEARTQNFSNTDKEFSAIYSSGLLTENPLNIELASAPTADVKWNASLPITVSYQ